MPPSPSSRTRRVLSGALLGVVAPLVWGAPASAVADPLAPARMPVLVRDTTPPPPPPEPVPPPPPCARRVKACVDLTDQIAWLLDGHGKIVRGPVPISSGILAKPTPVGMFTVTRKDAGHISNISGVPMPYSVFFDHRGDALHEGLLSHQSDGCVHLQHPDAVAFFDALRIGDPVQIVR